MQKTGVLLIVCGPSGVGKTSLCEELLEQFDRLQFSVSYTTRQPREDEVDGEDYHFVGEETFRQMREGDEFAEWARVHGNFYGTSFEVIRRAWERGEDLLFDIDYQGARQLQEHFPQSSGVLVIPPDMETLAERLRGRGSETEADFERRMENARRELAQYELFDYIVENDDFDLAAETMAAILRAARQQRHLQTERVESLLAGQ